MRSLGYINTVWAIIVPGSFSVYQMIVARTFINSTIPEELFEAATIDGCSDFRYFQTFVVPLSKAIITVMTLQYAVGHWNSWFSALIYLDDQAAMPMQLWMRSVVIEASTSGFNDYMSKQEGEYEIIGVSVRYAMVFIAMLPILCVYPFIQKYFVKGVMVGSLKG